MKLKERIKRIHLLEYAYHCWLWSKHYSKREKILDICKGKDFDLVNISYDDAQQRYGIAYYIDPVRSYTSGFCSNLSVVLLSCKYADELGFKPRLYHEKESHLLEKNGFMDVDIFLEYYFERIGDYSDYKWRSYAREEHQNKYLLSNNPIQLRKIYSEMMNKYFKFNSTTKMELDACKEKYLNSSEKTLGVKFRGTNYYKKYKAHPIAYSVDEMICEVNKLYCEKQYKKIYLATEDANALYRFQKEFGNNLIFNESIDRYCLGKNHVDNATRSDIQNAAYKEGLNLLKDLWVLSNCNGFIGVDCGVSDFAIVFNEVYGNSVFEDSVTLNKGTWKRGANSLVNKLNKQSK